MHLFYMHYLKPHSHPSEVGPVIPSTFSVEETCVTFNQPFRYPDTKNKDKTQKENYRPIFLVYVSCFPVHYLNNF